MIDCNALVGIPWVRGDHDLEGADCWGIITLFYDCYFNVYLPHFPAQKIDTKSGVADLIELGKALSPLWTQLDKWEPGSLILMFDRKSKRPEHIGVYLGDDMILHSRGPEGGLSEIHPLMILGRLFYKMEYHKYVG